MSKKVSNNDSNLDDDKKELDEFSPKIKKITRISVGGICCKCNEYKRVGDIEHIYVYKETSPRCIEKHKISKKDMSSEKNAIWICEDCHRNDNYKSDELKKLKENRVEIWYETMYEVLTNTFDDTKRLETKNI
ncbi:MAG: hypothetical protein K2G36_09850, partial [Ruminococcus sp.]|nr:hypothetical protein [Ruminococcus sp.]